MFTSFVEYLDELIHRAGKAITAVVDIVRDLRYKSQS